MWCGLSLIEDLCTFEFSPEACCPSVFFKFHFLSLYILNFGGGVFAFTAVRTLAFWHTVAPPLVTNVANRSQHPWFWTIFCSFIGSHRGASFGPLSHVVCVVEGDLYMVALSTFSFIVRFGSVYTQIRVGWDPTLLSVAGCARSIDYFSALHMC